MKFTGMMLSGALLLLIAVTFGEFYSTERKTDPEKRMMKYKLDPEFAAKHLYKMIRKACRFLKSYHQLGFLYLHGDWDRIYYGSSCLKYSLLKASACSQNFYVQKPFCPDDPATTNLLIALPDIKFGSGGKKVPEKNNHGHSEHKILEQLEKVREGFGKRYPLEKCPKYVILGTFLTPCDGYKDSRFGCAQDYVKAMQKFKKSCNNTKFFLYVPNPKKSHYWKNTKELMAKKYIDILTGQMTSSKL